MTTAASAGTRATPQPCQFLRKIVQFASKVRVANPLRVPRGGSSPTAFWHTVSLRPKWTLVTRVRFASLMSNYIPVQTVTSGRFFEWSILLTPVERENARARVIHAQFTEAVSPSARATSLPSNAGRKEPSTTTWFRIAKVHWEPIRSPSKESEGGLL
jgi:hypothetical protein